MSTMLQEANGGSRSCGISSIVVPLAGVGLAISAFLLCTFLQPDVESESFGAFFGFIIGGVILVISIFSGLVLALISMAREKCRSLAFIGAILSVLLLLFLLYVVIKRFSITG
jgi:hypothetical protein